MIDKNKLLIALNNFKTEFLNQQQSIDDKTNSLSMAGNFQEASAHSNIYPTIDRNITSIEKQIKRL